MPLENFGNSERPEKRLLLSIVELGGYPDFKNLYGSLGYQVLQTTTVRKALALLKKHQPDVIVAEFNFQSDFRDRTSSLESLLAVIQRSQHVRVIVFYDKEQAHQLERLTTAYPLISKTLAFPIESDTLKNIVGQAVIDDE
jgi:DNA-binding NtrC family response regulator